MNVKRLYEYDWLVAVWSRVRAGLSTGDLCCLGSGQCPRRAVWPVSRDKVVSLSTRLLLMRRTYEGRGDIHWRKSDVADWYGVLSHVKGVP